MLRGSVAQSATDIGETLPPTVAGVLFSGGGFGFAASRNHPGRRPATRTTRAGLHWLHPESICRCMIRRSHRSLGLRPFAGSRRRRDRPSRQREITSEPAARRAGSPQPPGAEGCSLRSPLRWLRAEHAHFQPLTFDFALITYPSARRAGRAAASPQREAPLGPVRHVGATACGGKPWRCGRCCRCGCAGRACRRRPRR